MVVAGMFEAAALAAAARADICPASERPLFTLRSLAAVSLLSKAPSIQGRRCPRPLARFDPSPELQGPQLESKAAKVARHSGASRASILVAFEVSEDGISLATPLSAKGKCSDAAPCGSSQSEHLPAMPAPKPSAAAAAPKRAAASAPKRAAQSEYEGSARLARWMRASTPWSAIEDATLRALMATQSSRPAWADLARFMPGRSDRELRDRWQHYLSAEKRPTRERSEAQSREAVATIATAVAASVVSAARTATDAPVGRLEPAASTFYLALQNPAAAAAAPMHLQGGASSIDDALAPSASPPALEIESLEMSDPESAPYPEMSETEVETELQNFDR